MSVARFLLLWSLFLILLGGLIAGTIIGLTNHSEHVSCLRLHEATGKPTKVNGSGATAECFIQIGDDWIPADRYRGVTEE